MTYNKQIGRNAAKLASKTVGVAVTFVEFDGTRYHFCAQWHRLYKIIGLGGKTERESSLSKTWQAGNEYAYFNTACYPEQLVNGDLEFMIERHMTQEIHERFKRV